MTRPVREQVNSLGVADYFNRLAFLMKENPPAHADRQMVKRMARLGIVPGEPFDIAKLSPAVIQVLEAVPGAAVGRLIAWSKAGNKAGDWNLQNGWSWTLKTGVYGTDYTQRALIAAIAAWTSVASFFEIGEEPGRQPSRGRRRCRLDGGRGWAVLQREWQVRDAFCGGAGSQRQRYLVTDDV